MFLGLAGEKMVRGRQKAGLIALMTVGLFVVSLAGTASGQTELPEFESQVYQWARECRLEVVKTFLSLVKAGELTEQQVFDTLYIPVPNTDPSKYHTAYDRLLDKTLQATLDAFLKKGDRLVYVVLVDRNGYLPTHNTRYSQPLTVNPQFNLISSRNKRIFNGKVGLAAARNKKRYLIQPYARDIGDKLIDLSVPVYFKKRHWGALRIGYRASGDT